MLAAIIITLLGAVLILGAATDKDCNYSDYKDQTMCAYGGFVIVIIGCVSIYLIFGGI